MNNLNSILLVFREYDPKIETIQDHQAIISKNTFVYWGWWKKTFEPLPVIESSSIIGNYLWLCDRNKNLFYKAWCVDFGFSEERKPSPNKMATPKYYSDATLHGWFKFTNIELASADEYNKLYGDVPLDENTLYILSAQDKQPHLTYSSYKSSSTDLFIPTNPIFARGDTILHISDLHFGSYHHYYDSSSNAQMLLGSKLFELIPFLIPEQQKKNIGLIVASGDFVSKNEENSFQEALDFLVQLCGYLDLDPKTHLIIIPGNHDLAVNEEDKNPFINNNFKDHYYNFRECLLGISPSQNIESLHCYYFKDILKHTNFTCFNTSEIRNHALKDYGHIDRKQYHILEQFPSGSRKQKEYLKNQCINFCVIHHHLLFPLAEALVNKEDKISTFPESSILVQKLSNIGFHIVLHGHLHIPVTGRYSVCDRLEVSSKAKKNSSKENSMFVLGAGSAGTNLNNMYDECPYNSFSTYKMFTNKNNIEITEYFYGKSIGKSKIADTGIGTATMKRNINI